jgi:hypothetical protein
MTIRDSVLVMIRERFPDRDFVIEMPPSPTIVTLEAPYPELGTLAIEDDGDEVTVHVGRVTHGHFNAFHEIPDDRPAAIADLLGEFLEALFADRVLLYRNRFSGGWRYLEDGEQPRPTGRSEFLWSRPVV